MAHRLNVRPECSKPNPTASSKSPTPDQTGSRDELPDLFPPRYKGESLVWMLVDSLADRVIGDSTMAGSILNEEGVLWSGAGWLSDAILRCVVADCRGSEDLATALSIGPLIGIFSLDELPAEDRSRVQWFFGEDLVACLDRMLPGSWNPWTGQPSSNTRPRSQIYSGEGHGAVWQYKRRTLLEHSGQVSTVTRTGLLVGWCWGSAWAYSSGVDQQ